MFVILVHSEDDVVIQGAFCEPSVFRVFFFSVSSVVQLFYMVVGTHRLSILRCILNVNSLCCAFRRKFC